MNDSEQQEKIIQRKMLIWLVIIIILQFSLFFLVKIAGIQTEVLVYQLF